MYTLPDKNYPILQTVVAEPAQEIVAESAGQEQPTEEAVEEAVEGAAQVEVVEAAAGESTPLTVEVIAAGEEEAAPDPIAEGRVEDAVAADEPEHVVESVPAAPPLPPAITSRIFSLLLVGNKYNPSNYWCVP